MVFVLQRGIQYERKTDDVGFLRCGKCGRAQYSDCATAILGYYCSGK